MTDERRGDRARTEGAAFLVGGGETGALMRRIDWAATPLGPPEGWPQSLKTCVRIILTSRQPMFVWWGDELINLYNDPYKAILGGKHPGALGQPASSVWREIWGEVGPRARSTMSGDEGTYDEALLLIMERNGYPEETYYTFSYSPVPNDLGGTGGIICANTDDTQRIIGERQMSLLRQLAAGTANARTWREACALAAGHLTAGPRDLPFAMIYVLDEGRQQAELAGAAGIAPGHRAAPARAPASGGPWPFARVLETGEPALVGELSALFGELPRGAWELPPSQAAVLPLAASGGRGRAGVLIVGLSPYRLYDEGYRGFLRLVAGQISASVAHAEAYDEERRRAEALRELDRAKTTFFSNISHEFRTPLTLILGPLEDALASSGGALSGENLGAAYRNATRLLKLVNALLDFSRAEAGREQASYEPTDLSALTADLASAFRAAVERAGLAFEVDCPKLPEEIFVDHEMWEKIVLNLLSNALKFTFSGKIKLSLRHAPAGAVLEVSDTGTGIPAAELGHLFERFHRVQGARARTHEGSGIGLALVHQLVELHGGGVEVSSELGSGTTFRVSIPRGSSHLPEERVGRGGPPLRAMRGALPYVEEALRWLPEPGAGAAGGAAREAPVRAAGEGARILLADDNGDMREYVARVLRERWTVETAADGALALESARTRPPDLVLTDVMMPNLDGFGLLRALREEAATRALPVIMLSARAGDESRASGLEAGADDYLAKPFSARELLARVATHLKLASLRAAAEQERKRLFDIFMQAPVPVAVFFGPEHRYEVANGPYCEMVGRPELVGKTVREAFPEIGEHEVLATLDRVYATGERLAGTELRVPLLRRGAAEPTEAYFNYVVQPLRVEDGPVSGLMVVATEVTEQVAARSRVEGLRAEAEQANRAKDEFLAMLGHELRNPLSPIVTALHLMRLRAGGVAEKEQRIIERQVSHLTRLVDDLLDVSRITRGKVELKRERIEIGEVIARAVETASPLLEERRQHLALSVPPRGLAVDADATRLAQVIANLLTNAAKYTGVGGHVAVDASREGPEVVVRVRDDGVGISAEVLPTIFDTFVQEKQALDRARGGLGLGLAIVRSLVSLHGGTASARSEGKGCGSEFVVRLPAGAARPSPPAESGPGVVAPQGARRPGLRILVVDDNEDAADLLAESLRLLGHEALVAHDGPEALRLAAEYRPQAGLFDIGLPAMDGYELARRIREQRGFERIWLVAVTGYGQASDRERSRQMGFDAHLVKPVDVARLETLLAEGLPDRLRAG